MEKLSNTCLERGSTAIHLSQLVRRETFKEGHLICDPLVLDDPWDEPDDLDGKIVLLLEEREPYLSHQLGEATPV